MSNRLKLAVLDEAIDARAGAIRDGHPGWPCRAGCDLCCRSLPTLPTMSEPEWDRVRDAIVALPSDVREAIRARVREVPKQAPVVCPLLDRERGQCLVYEARPVACRTYGFFADREAGLHCEHVSRFVDSRAESEVVVWGNGEAIHHAMRGFGEPQPLSTWLDRDPVLEPPSGVRRDQT